MNFSEKMKELARENRRSIVLPEANDPRTIKAAEIIVREEIADVILIGSEKEVAAVARSESADVSGARIVDPADPKINELWANEFFNLRKHKGVTAEQAQKIVREPIYAAAMMVRRGDADGYVSGAAHSTADTLRPALQVIKTAPGSKLVSSFFVMIVPDKSFGCDGALVYADCGLVQNPTAEELAEIAIASAESFRKLIGAEPNVAMLSFSTKGSGKDPIVEKVVKATEIAQKKRPDLNLDGELQGDSALIPSVGGKKAPGSAVAGKANVLIFPDLNAGNIAYKLTQRLAKAEAYGPLIQGIAKPVNDLSRGCSVDDIVVVTAVTAATV